MDILLYNKIHDQLIIEQNTLKQYIKYQIGGINRPYTMPMTSLDNVKNILNKLLTYDGYTKLKDHLSVYDRLIDSLRGLVNHYEGKIPDIMKAVDPSGFVDKLYNPGPSDPSGFKKLVDEYNRKLENRSWNSERLIKEIYNIEDPDQTYLLYKEDESGKTYYTDENFKNFNNQLLLLFDPYIKKYGELTNKLLTDQRDGVKTALDEEILNVKNLIKIVIEFQNYISGKKKSIESILKLSYNDTDLKLISEVITEDKFIQNLKSTKLDPSGYLNLSAIHSIEDTIKNTIDHLEIKDILNELSTFNLLDKLENMSNILNIEDSITINQSGGDFETKYLPNQQIQEQIITLLGLIQELFSILEKVIDESKYLQQIQLRYNYYIAFIFMIIKESAENNDLKIYKYINKNKIGIFLKIFKKIKNNFSTLNASNKHTIYLNKYHYMVIDKIIYLLSFINSKISLTDIIDIDNCTGEINKDFIIFNHFKPILIDYLKTSEGQAVLTSVDPTLDVNIL